MLLNIIFHLLQQKKSFKKIVLMKTDEVKMNAPVHIHLIY